MVESHPRFKSLSAQLAVMDDIVKKADFSMCALYLYYSERSRCSAGHRESSIRKLDKTEVKADKKEI